MYMRSGSAWAFSESMMRRVVFELVSTSRSLRPEIVRNDIAPEIAEIDVARGYRAPKEISDSHDVFEKITRAGLELVTISSDGVAQPR